MALKICVLVLLFLTFFAALVMWLWNWLIPELFQGPRISIFQAAGLLILCKILFGGFQKAGDQVSHQKKKYWRKKFEEKVSRMNPEEREKLESRFKKWGGGDFWKKDTDCNF